MERATRRKQQGRRRRSGFTLIELMVVVAIIMITAALIAPTMGRTMAASRAQRATMDVLRIARRGRSEAISYGRAMLLRYVNVNNGELELWRGTTDQCRSTPWATIVGTCSSSTDCADSVSMGSYSAPGFSVRMTTNANIASYCFQPNNEMRASTGGTAWFIPRGVAQRISIDRLDESFSTTAAFETRNVLLPFGTAPRIER